jgi:hypothetical protein
MALAFALFGSLSRFRSPLPLASKVQQSTKKFRSRSIAVFFNPICADLANIPSGAQNIQQES